jgi:hypothetical protein
LREDRMATAALRWKLLGGRNAWSSRMGDLPSNSRIFKSKKESRVSALWTRGVFLDQVGYRRRI